MSNKNLSDEIMSNLQLQKEYICLDLEDKALRLVFIFLIGLSITLCCTGLLYHFFGYLVAWIFIVVILITLAIFTYLYLRKLSIRKGTKSEEIRISQTRLHHQLSQMSPSPDIVIQICQTIRTINQIIREVKFLFKE